MGIEVGPPRHTQQELGGMQKHLEESQRQSAGTDSVAVGILIFVGIAFGLVMAFPKFFGALFSIIGWAITLCFWGAILYAAYRIYQYFVKIRAAKEQEKANAFPELINPEEIEKS